MLIRIPVVACFDNCQYILGWGLGGSHGVTPVTLTPAPLPTHPDMCCHHTSHPSQLSLVATTDSLWHSPYLPDPTGSPPKTLNHRITFCYCSLFLCLGSIVTTLLPLRLLALAPSPLPRPMCLTLRADGLLFVGLIRPRLTAAVTTIQQLTKAQLCWHGRRGSPQSWHFYRHS